MTKIYSIDQDAKVERRIVSKKEDDNTPKGVKNEISDFN